MRSIRKNSPVIMALLVYFISAWLLKILLLLGIMELQNLFSFQPSLSTSPFLGVAIFVAAEYIGFMTSIRWVAIPLSRITKSLSAKPKPSLLLLEWIGFGFYFVLLCSPLFLINAFPGTTIHGFPIPLPISKDTADFISFIWKSIVCLFAYRNIVVSYLANVDKEFSSEKEYLASVS